MKKLAIVIDIPNWAFDIGAQLIKKELKGIVEVDIFCIHVEPHKDDLFYMLEQIKNYDYIHFLWRKHLALFESEKFIDDVKNAGYDYDEYVNSIVPKISTAVCDHMFLKPEEIEEYKNIFNKFSSKYYVISNKLYDIYCNIPGYRKPESVIMDTYDKNVFMPQNLDRFDNAENRSLIIGWVGNSAWNSKDGNDIDYKGLHMILNPILDELISAGYNIQKNFADKQVKLIPNHDMPEYFKNIDVYVTCSYQEGTPRPALEAMSCGVPIIATDVGVIPDVLGNLQRDFIIGDRTKISDEDVKLNLKNSLITLYNNRSLLKNLSNENLENSKKLDSSNYKQAYIDFLLNR